MRRQSELYETSANRTIVGSHSTRRGHGLCLLTRLMHVPVRFAKEISFLQVATSCGSACWAGGSVDVWSSRDDAG